MRTINAISRVKRVMPRILFWGLVIGLLAEPAGFAGEGTCKPRDVSNEVNKIFYAYYGQYIQDKHDVRELKELKDNFLTVLMVIENDGSAEISMKPEDFSVTTSYGEQKQISPMTQPADKYLKFVGLQAESLKPGGQIERYALFPRSPKKEEPERLVTLHWQGKDYPIEKEPENP